jgi:hypothetical protein
MVARRVVSVHRDPRRRVQLHNSVRSLFVLGAAKRTKTKRNPKLLWRLGDASFFSCGFPRLSVWDLHGIALAPCVATRPGQRTFCQKGEASEGGEHTTSNLAQANAQAKKSLTKIFFPLLPILITLWYHFQPFFTPLSSLFSVSCMSPLLTRAGVHTWAPL